MHDPLLQSSKAGVLLAVMVFAATSRASACESCCDRCGIAEAESKICRLVAVEKKITVTCWSCDTEDICLPGPSKRTCRHCDVACDEHCDHCHGDWRKYFMWSEWAPCGCCAKIVTKRKLMKKTVTKTIPSYKWVVEDLCAQCEADCTPVVVPDGVPIPPAPAVEGAKVLRDPAPLRTE